MEPDQDKSISEDPLATDVRFEGAVGGVEVIEICAVADFDESEVEVALRTTDDGDGGTFGALYVTEDVVMFVRDPHEVPEHPDPESVHVTPLLDRSF